MSSEDKKAKTKKPYKRRESTEEEKPFANVVAERLIAQLEAGTAPWTIPWKPGDPSQAGGLLPYNPTTKKRYNGINLLALMSTGFTDNRWMTFKQALAIGACVKKGSKGTKIQFWSTSKVTSKKGEDGQPIKGPDGKNVKETQKFSRPLVTTATVFNAEQIDGLPEVVIKPKPEAGWAQIDRAEAILKASGAQIHHDQVNEAFYMTVADRIHMPPKAQFPEQSGYYATVFHELGHWSGHPSRLKREMSGQFGTQSYAKEELRAEIASMIIGEELGLGHDPGNHVAYVASWIQNLRDEPLEIFRAAADAEKILKFIMEFELKLDKEPGSLEDEDELEEEFSM